MSFKILHYMAFVFCKSFKTFR